MAAPARAPAPRLGLHFAALAVLFVVWRGAILFFAFDALFTPGYELHPMGTLASELVEGLPAIGVFEFHDSHSGGQILNALLSALAFAAFGPSYLSLKLVPLVFALATLLLVFHFVARRFGVGAGWLAALLLLFGPAAYLDYSSANYGNHSEVLAFVAFTFFAFHRRVVDREDGAGPSFVFGLACGLAVWYALSSLLLLALYAAYWWCAEGPYFLRRTFLPFVGGLAAGTAPLWYVMYAFDAPQTKWLGAKYSSFDWSVAAGRFVSFWTELLPNAACSYDLGPIPGRVFDTLMFAAWLATLLGLAWASRGAIARVLRRAVSPKAPPLRPGDEVTAFLAYPFALSAAYAGSNFKIGNWTDYEWGGYRYLLTMFLVLHVLVVIAVTRLRAAGWKRTALALAATLLLAGLLGNLGHPFQAGAFAKGLHYDGYHYHQAGRIFSTDRWLGREAQAAARLEALPPARRAEVYRGIGTYRAIGAIDLHLTGKRKFRLDELTAPWPERYRPFVAQGAGTWCAGRDRPEARKAAFAEMKDWRGPEVSFFVQGMLFSTDVPSTNYLEKTMHAHAHRFLRAFAPPDDRAGAQGLGFLMGTIAWRAIDDERAVLARVAELVKAEGRGAEVAYYMGMGLSCERYFEDPAYYDALANANVPETDRRYFYLGLGWMIDLVYGGDRKLLEALPKAAREQYLPQVERGLAWRDARGGFIGR